MAETKDDKILCLYNYVSRSRFFQTELLLWLALLVKTLLWTQMHSYITAALLPFTMAINSMLMQTLSTQIHGDIYLGDYFSIVKMIQTLCARKSWKIVLWRIWVTSQFIKVWIETWIRIRLQWGFLYLQFHAKRVISAYSCLWFFNQAFLSACNNSESMLTAKWAILPQFCTAVIYYFLKTM